MTTTKNHGISLHTLFSDFQNRFLLKPFFAGFEIMKPFYRNLYNYIHYLIAKDYLHTNACLSNYTYQNSNK